MMPMKELIEPALRYRNLRIALVVPCYNEGLTIRNVVDGFRAAIPEIQPYVFDNMSSDDTAEAARAAGATVVSVPLRGKGNVVRRMFADVDADVYIMVDGDDTYDASAAKRLVDKLIDEKLDMVVGCRETAEEERDAAYRAGHQFGNKLLTQSVVQLFGGRFTDMLSGYRVFSRRFVKTFPSLSKGFEIETELTVHALQLRMPCGEVKTAYGGRPDGSVSKLNTYRDGIRILWMIFLLFKAEKPLVFFIIGFVACVALAVGLAIPLAFTYLETGLVPRLPTAVLSSGLVMIGFLSLACGLILDTVTMGRIEAKRLAYLQIPPPSAD
ncbi:MAG: glycosyltransferase family 2 protein [Pseudomonadota bacterium]|nr:glycosyltransferase family 2 protein [Pseudomonadota bacterium]